MSEEIKDSEVGLLLEFYKQRYEHARMSEQLRASYFNIYVVVLGAGLAALADVLSRVPINQIGSIGLIIGSVMWGMSVLTIMRAERLGGHISHDLRAVSRIRRQLAQAYPMVQKVLPDPKRKNALDFRRPPWSRDKSVETLSAIIGTWGGSSLLAVSITDPRESFLILGLSGILTGYGVLGFLELGKARVSTRKRFLIFAATLGLSLIVAFFIHTLDIARVLIAFIGPITGFSVWMAEISNLEDRHQGCCLNLDGTSAVDQTLRHPATIPSNRQSGKS